jgi:hypothetical protein
MTNQQQPPAAPERIDADTILRSIVETSAGERIRMTCGAADLRSVITDTLEYARVYPVDDTRVEVTRCMVCRSEFTEAQIKGATCCPACGSHSVPMTSKEDVTIAINWHELRVLTIWAENYANSIKSDPSNANDPVQTVFGIAKRLQDQHPFLIPLTLSAEVAMIKRDHPGTTVHGNVTEGGPIPGGDNEVG